MRIISRRPLREFSAKWPGAAKPLNDWFRITVKSVWTNFAEVKATFGQTDQVRVSSGATLCVFDIGGNKFRLIALVIYHRSKVYVLQVLTHKEYDRQLWKSRL